MKRLAVVLFAVILSLPLAGSSAGATTAAFRPDAWIKLCGQSTGCTIDPLPHPWYGNNVYNTSAYHQTVRERIDNGEGVRFWLTFQNDGARTDTYKLHGCTGTKNFVVNRVVLGKYKVPVGPSTTENITDQFINNTWTFTLGPGKRIAITLNIITVAPGLTYRCPVTITSKGDPTKQDTVAAVMTSF